MVNNSSKKRIFVILGLIGAVILAGCVSFDSSEDTREFIPAAINENVSTNGALRPASAAQLTAIARPSHIPEPSPTAVPTASKTPWPTNTVAAQPTATERPSRTPEPSPTAVPQPTSLPPTATPQPTAVPLPTNTPEARGSNVIISFVNKGDEYVDIRNDGDAAQDLSGWHLLSELGNQDCPLGGVIGPEETLRIWAEAKNEDKGGYNCGFDGPIWNNSETDPAVLYNAAGQEVSRK